MTADPPPILEMEFLRVAASEGRSSEYVVSLKGLPEGPCYGVFLCLDSDTPACRAQALLKKGEAEEISDPLLKEWTAEGQSLSAIAAGACPFIHLLAANVPLRQSQERLSMQLIESSGIGGLHSRGETGFYPPSPPERDPAVHHYKMQLTLLTVPLNVSPGFSYATLLKLLSEAQESTLAKAESILPLTAAELRTPAPPLSSS
jgi:phosphatidylethanolamine-binding protein (PEBP) family uncharacterized protein